MNQAIKPLGGYGQIPATWDIVLLPEVVFFQEGPGLRKWQWTNAGMKVINVTNILGDGRVDTTNTSRFISMEEFETKYSHFVVDDRDVVVASSGNTYGKIGRITSSNLPLMMNTSVIRLHSADKSRLDDEFLYAFLRSDSFKNQIEAFVIGSAQPNFGPSHLKQVLLPLPALPVQKKIAASLSAYDDLIENNQQRIGILEGIVRAIYREWFVHFRRPSHAKFSGVTSPVREIPEGWEGRVGDIVTIDRDSINPFEYPGEEFEHFSIPAFDDGYQPTAELGETILSSKYCIDDSCVLLSKLNPRIPRVWLPAPSGQRRAITSTEFLVIKPRPGVTREFIYAKFCSEEFAAQFNSLAIGTSTSHQRVKPENFLAMPSLVPDSNAVEAFTHLVGPMLAMGQNLRAKVRNLRRTRDLLLPRFLSGQIDLSTADKEHLDTA
jgi:type I restriction enzyme S subunit